MGHHHDEQRHQHRPDPGGPGMTSDTTTAQRTIHNPVLPGFHPDPSILRVGRRLLHRHLHFRVVPGGPPAPLDRPGHLAADRRRADRATAARPDRGGRLVRDLGPQPDLRRRRVPPCLHRRGDLPVRLLGSAELPGDRARPGRAVVRSGGAARAGVRRVAVPRRRRYELDALDGRRLAAGAGPVRRHLDPAVRPGGPPADRSRAPDLPGHPGRPHRRAQPLPPGRLVLPGHRRGRHELDPPGHRRAIPRPPRPVRGGSGRHPAQLDRPPRPGAAEGGPRQPGRDPGGRVVPGPSGRPPVHAARPLRPRPRDRPATRRLAGRRMAPGAGRDPGRGCARPRFRRGRARAPTAQAKPSTTSTATNLGPDWSTLRRPATPDWVDRTRGVPPADPRRPVADGPAAAEPGRPPGHRDPMRARDDRRVRAPQLSANWPA